MTQAVTVVGGGVVGLATAHFLRRRGAEVTIVERSNIGAGASSGNAGWIVPSLSAPLAAPGMVCTAIGALLRKDGALRLRPGVALTAVPWLVRFARHCNVADHLSGLRSTATLAAHAVDSYDRLTDDGIDFAMTRTGLLSAYLSPSAARHGVHQLAPLQEFGYAAPQLLDAAGMHALEPSLGDAVSAGFLLDGERAVDPASLLAGLERGLRAAGVEIVENWPVTGWETDGSSVVALRGPNGRIRTEQVVVAAGPWCDRLLRPLGVRLWLQPGKGYSFTVQPARPPRRPLYFAEAKSGATPLSDGTRVVGCFDLAGIDERLDDRRLGVVARIARRYMRDWSTLPIDAKWCGLRSVTPDGLPVLGRLPGVDNVTVGTGHGLLGVTLGVASGQVLADLALGERPSLPGIEAFSVERLRRRRTPAPGAPPRQRPARRRQVAAAQPSKENRTCRT